MSAAEPTIAESQRAEELFNQGRAAMAKERFDTACAAFAESQKLEPAAGTLVNLGACLEAQGNIAGALAAYRASLALDPGTNAARELLARARITALETRGTDTEDRAGAAPVSAPENGASSPSSFEPGESSYLAPLESPVVASPASPVLAPQSSSRSTSREPASATRRVGLVLASGFATAGALGTVYFGLRAANAWDERQAHCPAHRCDDIAVAASSRANSFALAADVSAVVTGAALAAGLYFVFTPQRTSTAPRASVGVQSAGDHTELQWKSQF